MPSKFVRLKADIEIAINLENISHVVKGDHVLFVHFVGGADPLSLTKDAAEAFWRCIKGASLGIASYAKNQEEMNTILEGNRD